MAGSISDETYDRTKNNRDITACVRALRVSSSASQRQWSPIYVGRVRELLSAEWYKAHIDTAIPSGQQWSRRKSSRDPQASTAERRIRQQKWKETPFLQHRLAIILLQYRSTPHGTTGRTPAELFLERQLRTRFTLLKPNLQQTVEDKRAKQIKNHDAGRVQERIFQKGEKVAIQNYKGGLGKWTTGTVVEFKGPRTYGVRPQGKENRHVHADQMLPSVVGSSRDESQETL
jgi:hypothetical protein